MKKPTWHPSITGKDRLDWVLFAFWLASFINGVGFAVFNAVDQSIQEGIITVYGEYLLIPGSTLLIGLAITFNNRYIRELAAGIAAFSLIFNLGYMWTIASGAPIFDHPTHTIPEYVAIITQAAYIAIHFTHTEIAYHRHD